MTRRTFIKQKKAQGYILERDGYSFYLTKRRDKDTKIVIFIRKHRFTSSEDNFKKLHVLEWADIGVWGNSVNEGCLIFGDHNHIPFNCVDDVLSLFEKIHDNLATI